MDILHNFLLLLNNTFEHTHHYLSANTAGFITPTKAVMDEFTSVLMEHPKLILEGVPGSGKTTFIKYFLQEHPFIDSYLVDYTCSLEYTLSQILYEGMGKDLPYKKIRKLLKEKSECSLLVIDGLDLPTEELSQRLKILQELPLHIIVVTRNTTYTGSNFHTFYLPDFNDDNLLDLYQKISNTKETFKNDMRERFLTLTHKNILTASLLAYASKQDPSILDSLLSDEGTLAMPKMTPKKFKHPYDRQTQTLMGHLKKVYDKTFFETQDGEKLSYFLKVLCCFRNTQLPVLLLQEILSGFDAECLKILADLGYLDLINGAFIQMPPLLADVIYHDTPQPSFSKFSEMIENLSKYLSNHNIALDKWPITNILPPFIERLQPTVQLKNNPNQKKVSHEQEDWWAFVYTCIEYCQSIGDYHSAKAIIGLLQYPDKTNILYSQSETDKPILSALNAWLDNAPSFDSEIDSAIAALQELLETSKSTGDDPHVFMPNMVIYVYSVSLLFDKILIRFATSPVYLDRLDYYETIYENLWNSSESLRKLLMPSLKQNYYKNLMWVLFSSDNDFIKDFPTLFHEVALKYKNIELQIRLLSAIVIRCFKVMGINRLEKKYFIMYKFLNDELLPELTKSINKTLYLPKYTFHLCFYALLRYKLELGETNRICSTQSDFKHLIEKCYALSDDERTDYLLWSNEKPINERPLWPFLERLESILEKYLL